MIIINISMNNSQTEMLKFLLDAGADLYVINDVSEKLYVYELIIALFHTLHYTVQQALILAYNVLSHRKGTHRMP